MSGPETPSPNRRPEASPSDTHSNPPDPLLDSGSFIDADRSEYGAENPENTKDEGARKVDFGPGVVIAAEPISVFIPGENSSDAAPKSSARRRNPEEMAKRPSWLPEDWKIDLRVRSSGASAGLIDRYYVEPSGQRKFRSKNEVLHFLETGDKLKRKDAVLSGSPPSQKHKKSNADSKKPEPTNSGTTPNSKRKKSEAVNSDSAPKTKSKKSKAVNSDKTTHSPDALKSVETDES